MSRVVLFDVDGVLVNPQQLRWDDSLQADFGIDPAQFREKFIHELFMKQVLVGRMSLLEALQRTLPGLGYRGPPMAFVHYWLSHDSAVNQTLLDLVGRLKLAGARLYLATNQEDLRAQWLWQTLKFSELFEDIFHSAKAGALKPTRPYFDFVAKQLGPQAEPPLFFDDREDIIRAANAFGWEGVVYRDLADVAGHPWVAERLSIVTSR